MVTGDDPGSKAPRVQIVVTPEELGRARDEATGIEIEGDRFRHLFRARRLAAGTPIRIVDGQGRAFLGKVARVERRRAWIALAGAAESREPARRLELAVATLRMERAAWLVEKATEVGVVEIGWFNSRRAPRRYGDAQVARLERVARAAVEQCGRSLEPRIQVYPDWASLLRRQSERASFVLEPTADRRLSDEDADWEQTAVLIVGPEGGLEPSERCDLAAAGALSWSLGERILRAETAAVVGSALLLC